MLQPIVHANDKAGARLCPVGAATAHGVHNEHNGIAVVMGSYRVFLAVYHSTPHQKPIGSESGDGCAANSTQHNKCM